MPAQRPRLTIMGPLLRGSGELHIVGSNEVLTVADPDGTVHSLLALADGSRTRSEIYAELTVNYPLLGEQDVEAALCELEDLGLLEDCIGRGGSGRGRQMWRGPEQFVISSL
ncbi:MAG: hypothetical protein H0W96_12435 [Solirubrobacterales bacterium]|nr:hypothetical protein [Solirubrobacterales bacterium]